MSGNLKLIKAEPEFWEFMRKLRTDRRVMHGFLTEDYISPSDQRKYMDKNADKYFIAMLDGSAAGYIGVLDDDINVVLSKVDNKSVTLKIKNGQVSIDYVLSDLSVIADPPALKRLPEFETQIKLDSNFISTFIKGKGALSDVDTFTVMNGKNGIEIVIGYSSTNTNRVNIPVETETNDLTDGVSFNANLFKEVLVANKECTSAILEVSNEGLARVNFKVDDYDSTYYVVAMQDVD